MPPNYEKEEEAVEEEGEVEKAEKVGKAEKVVREAKVEKAAGVVVALVLAQRRLIIELIMEFPY